MTFIHTFQMRLDMKDVLGRIAAASVCEKDDQESEDRNGHYKGGDEQPFLRLVPRAPIPCGLRQ